MSENMHTVTHINSNFARGIMDNGRSSVNDHERDLKSRIKYRNSTRHCMTSVSPQFKVQPFNKAL